MDEDDRLTTIEKIQNITPSKKDLSRRVKKAERVTRSHARKFILQRLGKARKVQKKILIWIIAMGVLIAASAVQLLWYRTGYYTTAPSSSGIYGEGVIGTIKTLNPLYANSDPEEALSQLIFSRLLRYDTSGKIGYDLANSMKISADGLNYTISIRDGVLWQDGQDLTINDVLFTFGLLQNSATRSTLTGWSDIKITKVNDRSINFQLPAVVAPFASAVASVPILPEHILKDIDPNKIRESSFSSSPIGSGPFKVNLVSDIDVSTGRRAVLLDRFDNYFAGAVRLEKFQLQTYPDSPSLYKGLTSGEVIAAAGLDDEELGKLSQNSYSVDSHPINSGVYSIFNNKHEVLADVKVRKALQLSADTQEIRGMYKFPQLKMDNPLTNSQLGTQAPVADVVNLASANTLLDEAGWKLEGNVRKKGGKEFALSIVTIKGQYEKVTDKLVSYWSQLGAVVTTSVYDPTDAAQRFVQDILQARNYDVLVYQLYIGGDPDVYAYWHSTQANASGYNFANYANGVSDSILDSARSRIEMNLRQIKYLQFSRQWLADVPAIGLYQSSLNYAHIKSVEAFSISNVIPSVENRYADIQYWSVTKKSVYKTP